MRVMASQGGTAAVRGSFRLGFNFNVNVNLSPDHEDGNATALMTSPLAYDASPAELERALEALSSVGDVVVTSVPMNPATAAVGAVGNTNTNTNAMASAERGGYGWDVTFTGLGVPLTLGDLPLLDLGECVGGTAVWVCVEGAQLCGWAGGWVDGWVDGWSACIGI